MAGFPEPVLFERVVYQLFTGSQVRVNLRHGNAVMMSGSARPYEGDQDHDEYRRHAKIENDSQH